MKILLLNGPNLNLLGTREPATYGRETLADIENRLAGIAREEGVELSCRQSNQEGQLIDWIHEAKAEHSGIIINAGGYTHTSVALRDAIAGIALPTVEVHISNIHAREEFRHRSLLAPVCLGMVCGLGTDGYEWALRAMVRKLKNSGR